MVTTSSTTSTRTAGGRGWTRNRGPRRRSRRDRPVCGAAWPSRSSSRRHGTPRCAATPRATSSAWSKPRSRRRAALVGAHVTTSMSRRSVAEPTGEDPGDVRGHRPAVVVLEPEQDVADPPRVGDATTTPRGEPGAGRAINAKRHVRHSTGPRRRHPAQWLEKIMWSTLTKGCGTVSAPGGPGRRWCSPHHPSLDRSGRPAVPWRRAPTDRDAVPTHRGRRHAGASRRPRSGSPTSRRSCAPAACRSAVPPLFDDESVDDVARDVVPASTACACPADPTSTPPATARPTCTRRSSASATSTTRSTSPSRRRRSRRASRAGDLPRAPGAQRGPRRHAAPAPRRDVIGEDDGRHALQAAPRHRPRRRQQDGRRDGHGASARPLRAPSGDRPARSPASSSRPGAAT